MKILFFALITFLTTYPFTQEEVLEALDDFELVDEEPTFPGGITGLNQFLSENINYPQIAIDMGIEGKCYIQFTIESDGSVTNVTTLKGVPNCQECNEEAMRAIKLTNGKWSPALKDGKTLNYVYRTPINFKLTGGRKKKKIK